MKLVNWSSGVTTRNGYVCEPMTATCILLRRLCYPSRWSDVEELFRMHASALNSIYQYTGCLKKCVGFIDGTKIRMCRPSGPGTLQRSVYSGHKRMHCLVYQTITTPDGLIFHMYGPVEGRRPDCYKYCASNLNEWLRDTLLVAHPNALATPEQREYSTKMNAARTAVEWSYKDVKQSFASNDFARKLQVHKRPIAMLFV
eukprot:IDg21462t1